MDSLSIVHLVGVAHINKQFNMVPIIMLKKHLLGFGLVGSQKRILDSLRMHFLDTI